MFRSTYCGCFSLVGAVSEIPDIMIEAIVFHHFFPQWKHMFCQISTNFSTKDDIHIVCHTQI